MNTENIHDTTDDSATNNGERQGAKLWLRTLPLTKVPEKSLGFFPKYFLVEVDHSVSHFISRVVGGTVHQPEHDTAGHSSWG